MDELSVSNLMRNNAMRIFTMKVSAKTIRMQLLVTCLYQCVIILTLSHSESFLDDTQAD